MKSIKLEKPSVPKLSIDEAYLSGQSNDLIRIFQDGAAPLQHELGRFFGNLMIKSTVRHACMAHGSKVFSVVR